MIIFFPSSYSQRAPKIPSHFICSNSAASPPPHSAAASCLSSPPLCLGFLPRFLPFRAALLLPPRQRRVVMCPRGRASFWRKALVYWVEESKQRPICICFYSISTPCPLTLSGKSLLNSLLGQPAKRKGPGRNGRLLSGSVSICLDEASSSCLMSTGPGPTGWSQRPSCSPPLGWGGCLALVLRSWVRHARACPSSSPEEVLVRRSRPGLPVCTPRSPSGKSRELYRLPNEHGGFSRTGRLSFSQNLNLTLAKNK